MGGRIPEADDLRGVHADLRRRARVPVHDSDPDRWRRTGVGRDRLPATPQAKATAISRKHRAVVSDTGALLPEDDFADHGEAARTVLRGAATGADAIVESVPFPALGQVVGGCFAARRFALISSSFLRRASTSSAISSNRSRSCGNSFPSLANIRIFSGLSRFFGRIVILMDREALIACSSLEPAGLREREHVSILVKHVLDKLAVAGSLKHVLPDIVVKLEPKLLRNRLRVRENGRIVFRVLNALRRLRSGVGRFRYIDTPSGSSAGVTGRDVAT